MPRRDNPRYGFAMSQGGNLGYFDRKSGVSDFIKPVHPTDVPLRFNWNAALAQNPFHDCGIYYGSQFVHKSMDCGQTWEIISPDLTTNNPEKQKQLESGGLTIDATMAENNTTILAIAPSPVDKKVIWVGTDDGNLQLTTDGGETWDAKLTRNNTLIQQLVASPDDFNVLYATLNRVGVYQSTDAGETWNSVWDVQDGERRIEMAIAPNDDGIAYLSCEVSDGATYMSITVGT